MSWKVYLASIDMDLVEVYVKLKREKKNQIEYICCKVITKWYIYISVVRVGRFLEQGFFRLHFDP